MQGKTVIVTGATNGIGKITALELAKAGARVIIVGRSSTKVADTVNEIKAAAKHDQVFGEVVDLSLMSQVSALGERLKAAYPRIDVLVNNAGAFFTSRQLTAEGLEMTFALNHMNYFILTNALLDNLIAAAPARIVCVSSDAHTGGGTLDMSNLQGETGFSGFGQYSKTKLMNILFVKEMARRLAARGIGAETVSVNALHPGFVDSGFLAGKSVITVVMGAIAPLLKLARVMITPEQGAQTSLYLATSPQVAGITGEYFSNSKQAKSSAASRDDAAAARLWEISEQIAREAQPQKATSTIITA